MLPASLRPLSVSTSSRTTTRASAVAVAAPQSVLAPFGLRQLPPAIWSIRLPYQSPAPAYSTRPTSVLLTRRSKKQGIPSHCLVQRRTTKLQAVLGEAAEMDAYNFPDARLKKKMDDPSKTPLLLVGCGSFSPITLLHLRMFAMAGDYVRNNTEFEVVGGYLSPVSDAYKKQGLAPAEHRYSLSRFGAEQVS